MMKKKLSLPWVIFIALLCMIVTFQATFVYGHFQTKRALARQAEKYQAFAALLEVHDLYSQYYVRQPEDAILTQAVIHAYIRAVEDKYGYYRNESDFNEFLSGLQSDYSGMGCICAEDPISGKAELLLIMPDSPAEKAGLKAGDLILEINGTDVTALPYAEVTAMLLGSAGQILSLRVDRSGIETECQVVLGAYTEKTVWWELLPDSKIGLIRILSFDAKTPDYFQAALAELQESGAAQLIIDVRDNPGGLLDSVCKTLDRLLPEGPVVYTVRRGEEAKLLHVSDAAYTALPMVVLTNRGTASAGELFACALQDYAKAGKIDALLVGETTYGKGTMQELFRLKDGSGVSISVAYYNPPFSENYEGKGVIPDVICPIDPALADYTVLQYPIDQDNQLQKAVELFTK